MFGPLGQQVGRLFERLPPLRAYAWDLGGSVAGTVVFGVFSLYQFLPLFGVVAVAVIFVALSRGPQLLWNLPVLTLIVLIVPLSIEPAAVWSPYYYITVNLDGAPVTKPPEGLRTMKDPPIYSVHVNQDFYQQHGTIDISRYTAGSPQARYVQLMLRDGRNTPIFPAFGPRATHGRLGPSPTRGTAPTRDPPRKRSIPTTQRSRRAPALGRPATRSGIGGTTPCPSFAAAAPAVDA